MKKWTVLTALVMCLLLAGCGAGESAKADAAEAVWEGGEIVYDEYAWGTDFETIKADKITEDMEKGEDYGYYEDTGDFAKELIVDGGLEGQPCQIYYSFNHSDQLVSVMVLLNGELSDEEMVQLYLDQVEALKERYGDPGAVDNEYESGDYADLETYIQDVKSEGSFCIWNDSTGSQITASAYKSGSSIEALLRYSVAGYAE